MSVSLSRSLDTQCDLVFLFFSVKASTPVPRHQGPPVFSSSREDPSRSSSSHLTSYSPCIRVVCPLLDGPFVCLLYHPTSDSGLPRVLIRVGFVLASMQIECPFKFLVRYETYLEKGDGEDRTVLPG